MENKLIIRLSNEIGNQMFMYASAYSISKELNRILYIDNETAFLSKKNVSKFGLNSFKIKSKIAPDTLKFKNLSGYIKRKFLINTENFRKRKIFYIEKKNENKITKFSNDYKNINFNNNLFLEGHFESEKYFKNYKDEIINEFKFKDTDVLKKNSYFNEINKENTVSFCIRQNRFAEGRGQSTFQNKEKSWKFTLEQINYINKAANYIKSKISNPSFFLWSNDFSNIANDNFNFPYTEVRLNDNESVADKRMQALYLLTHCNHFIVTTSSFNWWGAWLSRGKNKIILRPSDKFFSDFYINNRDFWPSNWNTIDE
tara:strand:+ start:2134 stop:3075 length:942 start_codon:yes stop_codon:yes gene_type:complete